MMRHLRLKSNNMAGAIRWCSYSFPLFICAC
jgi:hypothetical protein